VVVITKIAQKTCGASKSGIPETALLTSLFARVRRKYLSGTPDLELFKTLPLLFTQGILD